jgi:hypothetical protein
MKSNIKEKLNLSMFSYENNLFYLYFIIPFLLGVLLGDYLGLDLSSIASRHIGLLRFIQSAGVDIRTKSIILTLYLIFAPCFWFLMYKYRKSNPLQPNPLKTASIKRLLAMIAGMLLMSLMAYAIIFISPQKDALISPNRHIRFLLAWSRSDVSFAIFSGGIVWGGILAALYAPLLFINELILRVKNKISNN